MINEAELRRMSPAQRQELSRILAELEQPAPGLADPFLADPKLRQERRLGLLVSAGGCVVLAGWIVMLAGTLPHHFDARHWRGVWVNFDVFLLAAFAATAWALWRERQALILLLMITGTMLCCDAWFDVGTSLSTSGFWISLLSALFAELPLAFLAFAGARRLLRATVVAGILVGEQVQAAAGLPAAAPGQRVPAAARGPAAAPGQRIPVGGRGQGVPAVGSCSLRRTPLVGNGLDEALPRGRIQRRAERARQSA